MNGLSKALRARLEAAGWSDSRAIDLGPFQSGLTSEGFTLSGPVAEFLTSFGGLHVVQREAKGPLPEKRLHLDPLEALSVVEAERIRGDYTPRLGKQLCPIGLAGNGWLVLVMDRNGAIYAGADDDLFKFGESSLEALEALCSGARGDQVLSS